jgi:hypothetical protein
VSCFGASGFLSMPSHFLILAMKLPMSSILRPLCRFANASRAVQRVNDTLAELWQSERDRSPFS